MSGQGFGRAAIKAETSAGALCAAGLPGSTAGQTTADGLGPPRVSLQLQENDCKRNLAAESAKQNNFFKKSFSDCRRLLGGSSWGH